MNKFFITERGDVAYQVKATLERLRGQFSYGDGILIVTKRLDFLAVQELCMWKKENTIVHSNITGFGGSYIEKGVPPAEVVMEAFYNLKAMGFSEKHMVLRIDPIIPTERGTNTAMRVLEMCPDFVKRVRISFIDQYEHMRSTMKLPWESFHAPTECQEYALDRILKFTNEREIKLEACGEPQLSINKGCISETDYDILGLQRIGNTRKGQRNGCMCLSSKTEILVKPNRCPNGCLYCYYRLGGR